MPEICGHSCFTHANSYTNQYKDLLGQWESGAIGKVINCSSVTTPALLSIIAPALFYFRPVLDYKDCE
ncbi:hypothetical protein [uncultured Shewanella sp.]|uniref:hypothetical protein n=1 Tax=uncultured Shewanella sp. TaxID=173975 RepID=UPI00261933CB|nr:hypothetical protein [uncultured Shewanella sp.]